MLLPSISHDNNKDCGPFPGTFGASSWYHAFKSTRSLTETTRPLWVKMVVHLVRNPVATVKSRMARFQANSRSLRLIHDVVRIWEKVNRTILTDGNETMIASILLRHWVHRNSFVSKHAQWRVAIEDLGRDPLHTWLLCLEVGRDDCPPVGVIRPILASMDHNKNTNGKLGGALGPIDDMTWWRQLASVDEDGVRIALKMASEYGYKLKSGLSPR